MSKERERELFINRIRELANQSYSHNRFVFSDFLSEAEYSDVLGIGDLPVKLQASGGHADAERVMVRFGDSEELGYEEPFPIVILKVSPLIEKFSDTFTHRDFLGALMNLGLERRVIGDILTDGTYGYVFCEEKIAQFILESFTKVKHTTVKIDQVQSAPDSFNPHLESCQIQLSNERLDAVVAHVCRMSRNEAAEAFRAQKVFVNSRLMENHSYRPKPDDLISVRGYGRFRYVGMTHLTKKGKINVEILKYV